MSETPTIFSRIEPISREIIEKGKLDNVLAASIAISLKRIADALERERPNVVRNDIVEPRFSDADFDGTRGYL